jgi:8-oxo-dGTP pyrophosphatase MutT (NUDIX family)
VPLFAGTVRGINVAGWARPPLEWNAVPSDDIQQTAASAARRATDDPNTFLIPEAQLPPGFADRVEDGTLIPAPPRPAATVALVRDHAAGPQVLLLRRHGRSGFAADAWVFPGGVVDKADREPELADYLDGPTPAEWAERLGTDTPEEALGFVAAALREAFEETGILLAHADPAAPSRIDDAPVLSVSRRALLDGVVTLRQMAVGNGVRLAGDALAYLAHWVTPEPEPRRYDTRFFLARAPEGAECEAHDAEMTDALWCGPAEVVERFERGQMKMLPPTVHTLRRLAEFGSVEEALAACRDAPVPAITPRMRRHPDGVAIEVPE